MIIEERRHTDARVGFVDYKFVTLGTGLLTRD